MIQALLFPPPAANTELFIKIFFTIDAMVQSASDDGIIEILSFMTSSDGSCLPFSFGLFHNRPEIYLCAARIILRLYIQKLGTIYCNPFIKFGLLNRLSPAMVKDVTKTTSNLGKLLLTSEIGLGVSTPPSTNREFELLADTEVLYSSAEKSLMPMIQNAQSPETQDPIPAAITSKKEKKSSNGMELSDDSLYPSSSFRDLYQDAHAATTRKASHDI
jgi:hypothetical protein